MLSDLEYIPKLSNNLSKFQQFKFLRPNYWLIVNGLYDDFICLKLAIFKHCKLVVKQNTKLLLTELCQTYV